MESRERVQRTNRNQYIATIAASLGSLAHGCISGWISPALPTLASKNTPLISGPLNNEQISWVGSIGSFGIVFGSIIFGFGTSIMGSKRASHSLAILSILFWLLIYFGNVYYHILLAKILAGVMMAVSHTAILCYIAEIANNDIRGRLTTINTLFANTGLMIGYILGTTLEYKHVPIVSSIIPIAFAIIFSTLPNTPQYYLTKGQFQEAELSLKYYKGFKGENEYEATAINEEFERLKLIVTMRKTVKRIRAADICNRNGMKGIGIGFALVVFGQLTANIVLQAYGVLIFTKTGTTFDPYLSAIIMAAAKILGSLLSSCFVDILGRKYLNFISLIGSAFALFTISIYQYLELHGYDLSAYQWVPVVSLTFLIFISSVGIMSLIFLCSIEHLEQKIRIFGLTIIGLVVSVVSFTCLKTFPILMELIELHGTCSIYGMGCIVGGFFVLFILKETKGQPLDDVNLGEDNVPLIPCQKDQTYYQSINESF